MSQGGFYFTLSGGRFVPTGDVGLGGSPGDGTLCVTGSTADLNATATLLNSNIVAVPVPIVGRWQVSWNALLTAQASGVRTVLVPTTA